MSEAAHHHPALAHHFENLDEQKEASSLGMWLFIAQEVMFFGGLFLAYTVYRNLYPAAFAEASHHLDWKLGGINTAVLILSSLTMALAVRAAALGHRKQIVLFLILTVVLGSIFLGVKVVEYGDKFEHHLVPGAALPVRGPQRAAGADLLLAVLRDDRPARAAHDHRHPDPAVPRLEGPPRRVTGPRTTRRWR